MDISKIFTFIRLTQKFRKIIRDLHIDQEDRFENDMEHSYQFAMFLWYLVTTYDLPYDISKLIKYALVHDLVEVYAGDTPALTSSEEQIASKSSKEEAAFEQIMKEVPEFVELKEVWEHYQEKIDVESRLVYVFDKIMPILNEIQQDSGFYIKNKISLEKWESWLRSKMDSVNYDDLVDAGFIEALLNYLESDKERLFFDVKSG